MVFRNGRKLKAYTISLGRSPVGPKTCQGDNKTPEGAYHIDARNSKSRYHLSLHISYPQEHDRLQARRSKCSPGGDIMIHGLPNGLGLIGRLHCIVDWTEGCIAVTDPEIEELWRIVKNGTPIEIVP